MPDTSIQFSDIKNILIYFTIYFLLTFINCFLCMYINHKMKYGSILFIIVEIILVVFLISRIHDDIPKTEITKSYLEGIFSLLFILFIFMLPAIFAVVLSYKTYDKRTFNYYNVIIGIICTVMGPSILLAIVFSKLKIKN